MSWWQHTKMVGWYFREDAVFLCIIFSITQFISVHVFPAYGTDIEEDIIGDTSGHFKKMLVVLLQVNLRDYSN